MRKVMNAVYYTIYEPAIQITVLKGKGDTALFHMGQGIVIPWVVRLYVEIIHEL